MKWQIINKNSKDIIKSLLENRNLKTKKEIDDFLNPKDPKQIKIQDFGIKKTQLNKILKRLKQAKENKEKIVIFGDYDADGVCATAILWETMYKLGYDVMPYIPDRFTEGYGLKVDSLEKINAKNPDAKLIITVDNGIVAYEGIKEAKKRGIDVIVVDHHTKGKLVSSPYCLHSNLVCGSALAWFLAREISDLNSSLDLVALGTIADQMPLLGINRSLVKFGLPELSKTKRVGLLKMYKDSKISEVGVYQVGYIIAPRINAIGRLASATDALRFLCTRDMKKAENLNKLLNDTNIERQKIVDEVLLKTLEKVNEDKIIVISGKYHEGVIGLASGKITEKFYRPSIVLSENDDISKASARSISGFNIIEAIIETGLILEGGGHPMAAGFSIETKKISDFRFKINKLSKNKLTDEILEKKLKIDLKINFSKIDTELVEVIKKFDPVGMGNTQPTFITKGVNVSEVKTVGSDGKHLKLKLEQDGIKFDAIWFNVPNDYRLVPSAMVDIVYTVEENVWNNKTSIQLKIRDIMNEKDILVVNR